MAAIALIAVPLLKGAVPVFVKIAAGGCWGSLIGQIDRRFLEDPENDVTAALHDWLKPAIDNVKDHVSKVARAEFLACIDKLQNGLIYLSELETKLKADPGNRMSDIATIRSNWSMGLSSLDDKETDNVQFWFRKAHSSGLKLSYNTQLELKWRLEAMSIVLFCMAFEHLNNPERLLKAWRRQLAEFLKDDEIQNILDHPANAKHRENLNTIREICYLIFAAVRDMTVVAIADGANSYEGYKLFVQNMAYGNTMEQVIVLTNMAWECGVIGKKTRVVAYDAEKIVVTTGGRLTVMKRGTDVQFVFAKAPTNTEIENESHRIAINSIAALVVEEIPLVCIADVSGDIFCSWGNRLLFSVAIVKAPVTSSEAEIVLLDTNRLFAAVVKEKELYIFETRLNEKEQQWKAILPEPEPWQGSSSIRFKGYCDPETHQINLAIYEKQSGWYGQSILFIDLEGSAVTRKDVQKVKCAFGSRKQRFAFCLNSDTGLLISTNKERPNTKGGPVGVKIFPKKVYDKPEEEQSVKPQAGSLRDIAACDKVVALAFYG